MKITKKQLHQIIKEEIENNKPLNIKKLTDDTLEDIIKEKGQIEIKPITDIQDGNIILSYNKEGKLVTVKRGNIRVELFPDGAIFWYENDELHRDGDYPALTTKSGTKKWIKNGQLHRDGGLPAVIWSNGKKEWWVKGREKVQKI